MPIAEQYMSPNLRWGLYLQDHPGAPQPVFAIVAPTATDVPAGFCTDEAGAAVTDFVRCTLCDAEGRVVAVGDKEIPSKEKRRTGQVVVFRRTAESWRKLRTMALGRALKAAGYPDMSTDLRVFLQYRHRLIEFGLAEGTPTIGAGDVPQAAGELVAHDPETGEITGEHEDLDPEIVDGEVVAAAEAADADPGEYEPDAAEPPAAYPPALAEATADMTPAEASELARWMDAAGYTTEVLAHRSAAANTAVKRARAIVAKRTQAS